MMYINKLTGQQAECFQLTPDTSNEYNAALADFLRPRCVKYEETGDGIEVRWSELITDVETEKDQLAYYDQFVSVGEGQWMVSYHPADKMVTYADELFLLVFEPA